MIKTAQTVICKKFSAIAIDIYEYKLSSNLEIFVSFVSLLLQA
jgi:hypothetical protein